MFIIIHLLDHFSHFLDECGDNIKNTLWPFLSNFKNFCVIRCFICVVFHNTFIRDDWQPQHFQHHVFRATTTWKWNTTQHVLPCFRNLFKSGKTIAYLTEGGLSWIISNWNPLEIQHSRLLMPLCKWAKFHFSSVDGAQYAADILENHTNKKREVGPPFLTKILTYLFESSNLRKMIKATGGPRVKKKILPFCYML